MNLRCDGEYTIIEHGEYELCISINIDYTFKYTIFNKKGLLIIETNDIKEVKKNMKNKTCIHKDILVL